MMNNDAEDTVVVVLRLRRCYPFVVMPLHNKQFEHHQ